MEVILLTVLASLWQGLCNLPRGCGSSDTISASVAPVQGSTTPVLTENHKDLAHPTAYTSRMMIPVRSSLRKNGLARCVAAFDVAAQIQARRKSYLSPPRFASTSECSLDYDGVAAGRKHGEFCAWYARALASAWPRPSPWILQAQPPMP